MELKVRYIIFLLVIIASFISFLFVLDRVSKSKEENFYGNHRFNAVIVDQLSFRYPNEDFIGSVKEILESKDFNVIVFKGEEVNVSLFKRISRLRPNLLIIRAHSGTGVIEGKKIQYTFIFTNERYSTLKYPNYQLKGYLLPVKVNSSDRTGYFGVGRDFILSCIDEDFPSTVVFMMGCSGLKEKDLAEAFIEKGCSLYIAWDSPIEADVMDKGSLIFLKEFVEEEKTIYESIKIVNKKFEENLLFYPEERYNSKLFDLIYPIFP